MRMTGLVVMVLVMAGCGREKPPAGIERTYAMRGIVESLPVAGRPVRQVMIEHEPVKDFADATGKVVGMDSMEMPFDLGPGASAAGLKVGDKISFTLHMNFTANESYITDLQKLPPGTALHFGPATGP